MTPTLGEAAALFRFNLLPSELGPAIAERAILDGAPHPTLSLLLVETDLQMSTVGPLLEATFAEAGLNTMTGGAACFAATRYYAKQVTAGVLDPVAFGFQMLAFERYTELPADLKEIVQQAMWYEEAPNEWGYPEDWQKFRSECLAFLQSKAQQLASFELDGA